MVMVWFCTLQRLIPLMIRASLHHITGVASPLMDPPHRGPPTTQRLRVTETGRQWGKAGPNGMEGGGLLVSLAWRSRALGMARAQNKVVPSEPREGDSITQPAASCGQQPLTYLKHTQVKWNRPGGFSIGMITACMEINLK